MTLAGPSAALRWLVSMSSGEARPALTDDGPYPVIGAGGVMGHSSFSNAASGHVAVGRVGTVGSIHLIGERVWMTDNVLHLRPSSRIESRFLAYVLRAADLKPLISTTAQPLLTGSLLGGVQIPIFSSGLQSLIADYLDTHTAKIDLLIEKQERLIDTLAERRQAVIDARFVSSEENRSRRLRNLLLAKPTYGVLVPVYVEADDSVPFIRVGDLAALHGVSPSAQISKAQCTEYSRTRIVGGEVLLGVVGRMGQVAIAPDRLVGANVARAIAVLRCTDQATSELLALWLTSTMFRDQAGILTSGDSVQPTLGMGDLAVVGMQWPKDAETRTRVLSELKRDVAVIDDLRAKATRFIELSKERRQALISAAVTGKIDVRGLS